MKHALTYTWLVSLLATGSLSFSTSLAQTVGDIIVTEIMQDPTDVSPIFGEWFEVYNATGSDIDLNGWAIRDRDSDTHLIGSSVIVPAGDYAMLCRNSNTSLNGGFTCNYAFSFSLDQPADEIIVVAPDESTEIDVVQYTGGFPWPDPSGASMVFTGSATDNNNDGLNWTTATTRESSYLVNGNTDKGSPGTTGNLGTLPVELVSFDALADGADVLLTWSTASETNNAGFEVQGVSFGDFTPRAFVEGHGTTLNPQTYRYRAEGLLPGPHRFRLKQIDYDGAFTYSPEVEVVIGMSTTYHLSAPYPNPFNPQTQFSLSVARRQHVEVIVYDVWGRRAVVLYTGLMETGAKRALMFEAAGLPNGMYLIRIEGTYFHSTRHVVLVK